MDGEMNGEINEQTDGPTIEHTSSSTVERGRMKWLKSHFPPGHCRYSLSSTGPFLPIFGHPKIYETDRQTHGRRIDC